MLQCKEIDELMMDWLYQELEPSRSQAVEAHVGGCARCTAEVGSLRHTRDVFRDLSIEEPPASVSAILLHEAARRAPAVAPRGEAVGFWDRLRAWFQPLFAHPAAAAVATLVLVAGVAGALYVRRGSDMSESGRPVASSAPEPARPEEAARAPGTAGSATVTATPTPAPIEQQQAAAAPPAPEASYDAPADGYAAGLLDEKTQGDLHRGDMKGEASDRRLAKNAERAEDEGRKELALDLAPAKPAPAKKAAKPSPKSSTTSRANVANAVSAADPLVSGVEPGGMRGGGSVGGKADAPRMPPPQATPSASTRKPMTADDADSFRPYRDRKPPTAEELKWLGGQQAKLSSAVKAKRCVEAAKIANDILDRNPDYYVQQVSGRKTAQPCQMAVATEASRRARARSKNVGDGSSQAAPPQQQQKAKSAPREADEAAAETTAE
jgi:hypothetical protein